MVDHDLVLARDARDVAQHVLDLAGVNVDALDLDHVVATADQDVDARERRAAGAFAGHDARQVVRAVADQRRALLPERRDDELAVFAVRQHRAGLRVDDLEVDEIVQ